MVEGGRGGVGVGGGGVGGGERAVGLVGGWVVCVCVRVCDQILYVPFAKAILSYSLYQIIKQTVQLIFRKAACQNASNKQTAV